MRHPYRCLQAISAIFLLWSSPAASAEETWEEVPVPNGSFEQGKYLPSDWQAMKGNNPRPSIPTVFAWDKEYARTGKRSLYILKKDIGPVRWRCLKPITVIPGEEYQLRFWFRAGTVADTSVGVGLSSESKDENGKPWQTGRIIEISEASTEWQPFILDFTLPPGVSQINASLMNMGGSRSGVPSEIWYDDLTLFRKVKP